MSSGIVYILVHKALAAPSYDPYWKQQIGIPIWFKIDPKIAKFTKIR